MHSHPHLYEINARLFLRRLGGKYRRTLTLATVPDDEWRLLAQLGFDLVWLMGVWQRSFGSRKKALQHPALRLDYDKALPDWQDEDVAGSPYAVYAYTLDSALGEPEELPQLREKLNRLGLRLIVDFVPNHLAYDHPWVLSHPEWFVRGKEADARANPDWFFSPAQGVYLAHGRDPYFPPWTDTAQMNFHSTDLRHALINEMLRIAEVADGVRCDMAMLVLNDVFGQIWGKVVSDFPRPATEFWSEAIERVKQQKPDFLFLAEAYWGLEWKLQTFGFDFTYDKTLYDRLRHSTPSEIRAHLRAEKLYQQRSIRFIENHDEPRAVTAFGQERSLAAAVVMATVPGLRLFHDGQLEGRRIRVPVQLAREPDEAVDAEIMEFYQRLLTACRAPAFHEGEWSLLEVIPAGTGNESHHNLLAWCWRYAAQFKVVVVNYSPNPAQGRLKLPPLETKGKIILRGELSDRILTQNAGELMNPGLYLDLSPWQACIFDTVFISERVSEG
jgi:hypothetical protein